jgi:hypothetical protein
MDQTNTRENVDKMNAAEREEHLTRQLTDRGFHPIAKTVLLDLHNPEGLWLQEASETLVAQTAATLELVLRSEGVNGLLAAVSTLIAVSNSMFTDEASKPMATVVHAACDRMIKAHNLVQKLEKRSFQSVDPAAAAKAVAGIHDNLGARAPKFGEAAPAGAVKAGSLGGPKRRI